MVRIVLCVLCLVVLALPASAHKEWIDPFHTHQQQQESFYENFMQNLEQERRETIREREQERRHRENHQVRETNCLYGRDHFNKCL